MRLKSLNPRGRNLRHTRKHRVEHFSHPINLPRLMQKSCSQTGPPTPNTCDDRLPLPARAQYFHCKDDGRETTISSQNRRARHFVYDKNIMPIIIQYNTRLSLHQDTCLTPEWRAFRTTDSRGRLGPFLFSSRISRIRRAGNYFFYSFPFYDYLSRKRYRPTCPFRQTFFVFYSIERARVT